MSQVSECVPDCVPGRPSSFQPSVNWSISLSVFPSVCPSLCLPVRLFLPQVFPAFASLHLPVFRSFPGPFSTCPTARRSTCPHPFHTCHPPPFLLPNVFVFAGCRFPPLQGPRPAFPSIMAVYLCSPRPNSPGCVTLSRSPLPIILSAGVPLTPPPSLPFPRVPLPPPAVAAHPHHPPPSPSTTIEGPRGRREPLPRDLVASPRPPLGQHSKLAARNTHTAKPAIALDQSCAQGHPPPPFQKTKSKQRLARLSSSPLSCHESACFVLFFPHPAAAHECCAEHVTPMRYCYLLLNEMC